MKQLKAFKFRIEPNKQQQVLINKTLGCTRFLYNQMLEEKQVKYKAQDKSKNKTEKEYKIEFDWLKEVDSIALQQARIDLKIDSDYNASLNILEEGLRILKKNCRDDKVSLLNIQMKLVCSS